MKKQYICPQMEVVSLGSDEIMRVFGSASMPANMSPARFRNNDYRMGF